MTTYHQRIQEELNRRQPCAAPHAELTADQLLAISRRPLPVFNVKTGERIV